LPSGDHDTPITGPLCPLYVTRAVELVGTEAVGVAGVVGVAVDAALLPVDVLLEPQAVNRISKASRQDSERCIFP
jgi:hypothetical protein